VKDTPKRGDDTPKRANGPRQNEVVDEVVVVRRPPPRYYDPSPGPSIGIGIDLGGGSFGGGGMDRGGMDRGGGGPNRRGGY
jgi:hypothetical protein